MQLLKVKCPNQWTGFVKAPNSDQVMFKNSLDLIGALSLSEVCCSVRRASLQWLFFRCSMFVFFLRPMWDHCENHARTRHRCKPDQTRFVPYDDWNDYDMHMLAGRQPRQSVTDLFSHGPFPASVISDGVMWACLSVPACPWETLDEVLLWENEKKKTKTEMQEPTCCCFAENLLGFFSFHILSMPWVHFFAL